MVPSCAVRWGARRSAADVGLAVLVVVSTVGNAWWVQRHRLAQEVDVDEAILLVDAERVRAGIVGGWFDVSTSAPLTRMATAASIAVFGRSPLAIALPVLLASAVLIVGVYVLARQLGAGPWALLAAALVSVAPTVVQFSRSFHQIIPAAAAIVICVIAALRSDGFRDRRWALVLGACLGLALLTRAMLVAFVPIVVLGTLLEWRMGRSERPGFPVGNAVRSGLVMVLVAATWWAVDGLDALRYLVRGSGPDSGKAVTIEGRLPSERELRLLGRSLAGPEAWSLRWVLVFVLALGTAVLAVRACRARTITPRQANVALFLALGLVVLVLNTDGFPGFVLLILPVGVAWVVALAARATGWVAGVVLAAVAGSALFGAAGFPSRDAGWYAYGMEVRSGWTSPSGRDWAAASRWVIEGSSAECRQRILVVRFHDLLSPRHLEWTATVTRTPVTVLMRPAGGGPEASTVGDDGWLVLDVEPPGGRGRSLPEGFDASSLRRDGFTVIRRRVLDDGSVVRIWAVPGSPTCLPAGGSGPP